MEPVIATNALSHLTILWHPAWAVHFDFQLLDYFFFNASLMQLHPGNGLIFPCSNDFNRWARISFWSQRMELGDSPMHKEVAAAIVNRAQSLPPSCNWELVIQIVKWGAEQWSKAAICLMMWGDTFPHNLSYMLMVLGGHPMVETQTQCLFESFRIWTPSPTKILHLPASASVGNWSPSTVGNPSTLGISLFRSICAAAICVSDSQSPISINRLSSALRNSSGSHFPSSTSLSSSEDMVITFSLFPLLPWGWLVSLLSDEDALAVPSLGFVSLGLIVTTVISRLRVVVAFTTPMEEQIVPFFRQMQRWLVHPILKLQKLDWNSFWGLRRWAASHK